MQLKKVQKWVQLEITSTNNKAEVQKGIQTTFIVELDTRVCKN